MNILLQVGIGVCDELCSLTVGRHREMARYFDGDCGVRWRLTKPDSATMFWEKWRMSKLLLEDYRNIVAVDADILWGKKENIFEALPPDQHYGCTWIHGVPSAGVLWLRNSPESRRLVDRVIGLEERFQSLAGHDQSAMVFASKELGLPFYRVADKWHGETDDSVLQGFHRKHDQRLDLMRARLQTIEQEEARAGQIPDEKAVQANEFAARRLQFAR